MYLFYLTYPNADTDDDDAVRVRALPEDVKRELLEYGRLITAGKEHPRGGICIWYDEATHGCKHYELRPQICRDFEMGTPECREWRENYGIE